MKSNIGKRLLNFVVGIPAYILFVGPAGVSGFLLLRLIFVGLTLAAGFEASRLFSGKSDTASSRTSVMFIAATPSLAAFLSAYANPDLPWLELVLGFCFLVIAVSTVIQYRDSTPLLSARLFQTRLGILLYPGMLVYWLHMILTLGYGHWPFTILLFINFGNDSFAYIGGALFGSKSGHPAPMSPNKTTAGFFTGSLFSLALSVVLFLNIPLGLDYPLLSGIIMGIVISVTSIFGDLLESALKRARGLKDSGSIFPGRGGVLDSIDSLLLSGPAFYLVFMLLPRSLNQAA